MRTRRRSRPRCRRRRRGTPSAGRLLEPRRCRARFVAAPRGRDRAGAEESARVAGGRLPEAARGCPGRWPALRAQPRLAPRHARDRPERARARPRSGSRSTSATSSAAIAARRRCPRSFQERTNDLAPLSYTRAARARRKREPAPRAFGAALHGPGAGRAAALADRGAQSDEGVATGLAESGAGPPADRAALRKEQLEHVVIVGRYSLRLCEKMRSASWSVSAEPMSYHCPGSRQV